MIKNSGREWKEETCVREENLVVSNANKALLEGCKERMEQALKDEKSEG